MPSARAASTDKPRRALVTGGAIRLGRAMALALADAGMDVVIGYHASRTEAHRTVTAVERRGRRAVAIGADLRRAGASERLVEGAAAALDGLDVLVNNAAIFARTPFMSTTPATLDEFLAVNLRAAFLCAQSAARMMGPAGGHIVNVSDAAVARPMPGYIPYAVSKAALEELTRHLAAALRSRGIAVNCIAPGAVLRPRGYPRARWEALTRGRPLPVEAVAAAVRIFATCPLSITGQTLAVE